MLAILSENPDGLAVEGVDILGEDERLRAVASDRLGGKDEHIVQLPHRDPHAHFLTGTEAAEHLRSAIFLLGP